MRKAFGTVVAAASVVEAKQTSPFVGEHANASTVDHGDGSISMRMKAVRAPYNKYENLIARDVDLFRDRKPVLERLSEFFFG